MGVARALSEAFLTRHPDDVADVLRRLPAGDVAAALAAVDARHAAPVLRRLAPAQAPDVVMALGADAAVPILASLPAHEVAATLRRLRDAAPLLAALPGPLRADVARLLRHAEGTAGALADASVVALPEDYAVAAARRALRHGARPADGRLFVVAAGQRLTGAVETAALLAAPPATPLATLATRPIAALRADADHAAIVVHPGWTTLPILPVVDETGVYLGAIRHAVLRRLAAGGAEAPAADTVAAFVSIAHACVLAMAGVLRGLDPEAWRMR